MIPYNTNAPLYHMPIATVGLIVINTVLFILVPSAKVDFESLASSGTILSLEYGQGIKPWQWLTSIFMHANFVHLLFNMIALWAFGLVVEGKVGLLPFLGIYLGIGVTQSAFEQLLMCMYGEGGSLGASAAIFGILGVAIVWAPRNDFEVFYQFGFRMGTAEIPIMMYGFLQFALEVFNVVMGQFGVSAGVLHLMGFALGIAVGFVWLVRGWVDCEGWDLVTVLKGHEGRDFESERLEKEAAELVDSTHRSRSETAVRVKSSKVPVQSKQAPGPNNDPAAPAVVPREMFAPPAPSADDFADLFASQAIASQETADERLVRLIDSGKHQEAVRELIQLRNNGAFELSQMHLAKLVRDLLTGKDLNNAIPLMAEHIRRFTENRVTLQINLSKVLLQKERPQKALQVLKSIDKQAVDAKWAETIETLTAHAKSLVEANAK
jgi:membrane associated rhomboid family serine protease